MTSNKHLEPNQQAADDDQQMQSLRTLVLGENHQIVRKTLRDDARQVVGEVFSEALLDRQKSDGSVDKVLQPLVSESVKQSVANHKDELVNSLYPLVGSLVRKSVSAFLTDFMENTNRLLENSLTAKGLSWRFQAWRANVPFSQFVASQTFQYRVEQVMLIHRETGILLKHLSYSNTEHADADMVSGMLTAINDFVSDSFASDPQGGEQQLDVVKTGDFTLLIKQGPQAMLVAAVRGNVPQEVANQLQISLEQIHRLYGQALSNFTGDTETFEGTSAQLRECFFEQLKPEVNKSRKPWIAWILVLIIAALVTYVGAQRWKAWRLTQKLNELDQVPGIWVKSVGIEGLDQVILQVHRDPQSQNISDWLVTNKVDQGRIRIVERPFISLDKALTEKRLQPVLLRFPQLRLDWQADQPKLLGQLLAPQLKTLTEQLNQISGLDAIGLISSVDVQSKPSPRLEEETLTKALLSMNIQRLNSAQIAFHLGKSEPDPQQRDNIRALALVFLDGVALADQLGQSISLLIIGTSDAAGSKQINERLSKKRAQAVKKMLIEAGISADYLNTVGIGTAAPKSAGARQVLFKVVTIE